MAQLDFSQNKHFQRFTSNEQMKCGSFKVDESGPITRLVVGIYVKGFASLDGAEAITLKIHADNDYSRTLHTCTPYKLSDLSWGGTAEGFLGRFGVVVDNYYVSSNKVVYISATISNYTQNGVTHYVAIPYDWPQVDSIYADSVQHDTNPLQVELYQGLRR